MARSHVELMGLEFEAERLVRSGTSRAEVARLLGVHPQTLSTWALRGGWRKKDLELEASGKITRRVVANVAASHGWARERTGFEAEQRRLVREAIGLIVAGDGEGLARLMAQAPADGMRARPVLESGVIADPRMEGIRSIGDFPVEGGVMSEEEFSAPDAGVAAYGEDEEGG